MSVLPTKFLGHRPVEKPLSVFDVREQIHDGQLLLQLLVQWEDRYPENAIWEWKDDFIKSYLDFYLEDKVIFQEKENDRPPDQVFDVGAVLANGKNSRMKQGAVKAEVSIEVEPRCKS